MCTPAFFPPWLTNASELKWDILMPQDIPWEAFSTEQFKTYIEWNKEGKRKKVATCFCFLLPTFFSFAVTYRQISVDNCPCPQTAFKEERCWNYEGKCRHWWKLMLENSTEAMSLGYQYFFFFPSRNSFFVLHHSSVQKPQLCYKLVISAKGFQTACQCIPVGMWAALKRM